MLLDLSHIELAAVLNSYVISCLAQLPIMVETVCSNSACWNNCSKSYCWNSFSNKSCLNSSQQNFCPRNHCWNNCSHNDSWNSCSNTHCLNGTLLEILRSARCVKALRGAVKKTDSIFKDIVQIGGREVNPISKK